MAHWYVRPSGGGGTGTSWNNAFNGWPTSSQQSAFAAGDTVWIAGGTYGLLTISKGGSSGANIVWQRVLASDTGIPGQGANSPGFVSSFDSTIIITGPDGNDALVINPSFVTVDGRVGDPVHSPLSGVSDGWGGCRTLGIQVLFSQIADGGQSIGGSGLRIPCSGQTDIRVFHCLFKGPLGIVFQGTGPIIPPDTVTNPQGVRCGDITGSGSLTKLWLAYCDFAGGGDAGCYISASAGIFQALVEYCSVHDHDARNTAQEHPNTFFNGIWRSGVIRYCLMYHICIEGMFWGYDGTGVEVYRNVFVQGGQSLWSAWRGGPTHFQETGRGLTFPDAATDSDPSSCKVYNNTFVSLPTNGLDTSTVRTGTFIYQDCRNNIHANCNAAFHPSGSPRIVDYNFYCDGATPGGSEAPGGANSILTGAIPFASYTRFSDANDYHLISTIGPSYPRGKGVFIPPVAVAGDGNSSKWNLDMDGKDAGTGAWDMGAFSFSGGGGGGAIWPVRQI